MYETVRELIAAENQIEGVLAGMLVVPPEGSMQREKNAHFQGGLVDGIHPELRTQDWGWAYKFADVHVIHYSFDLKLGRLKPKVFFAHGCFHKNQLIRMGDGSMKRLRDIQLSELVPSRNQISGEIELKPVIDIGPNGVYENWFKVKLSDGPNIICTDDHPFYTAKGKVPARDLTPGTELLSAEPLNIHDSLHWIPDTVKVLSIKPLNLKTERWAITVADNHNYLAGACLVDNTPEAVIDSGLREPQKRALLAGAQWIDKFEATIVTSQRAKQFWTVFDSTDGKKINVVSKGIDLEWWQRSSTKADLPGEPSVLYGEVWRGIKHPTSLLFAINEIYKDNPEIRLNAWSLDHGRNFWENLIAQAGFKKFLGQDNIPGVQDYPEHFYSRGDVLVSPVQAGDLSRVSQEAMASGCPVVSWDTDPWGENYPYKAAKGFDILDMASKIEATYEEILDDPESVATKCRAIAEKYYNIHDEAKSVVEILRKVVSEQ